MPTYDLLIVGGGIAGLSTAYRAAQLGARTLLLDRHDRGRATDAGAGILSPQTSTRDGRTWYDFAMSAVRYYEDLTSSLQADGIARAGLDSGYSQCPKLVVAMSEDELPAFEKSKEIVLARQDERGDGGDDPIRQISLEDAQTLLPPLGEALAVLYQPIAGRVDGRVLSAALRWALDQRNVERIDCDIVGLAVEKGRVIGVDAANGSRFLAGSTVIAGGAWSPRSLASRSALKIAVEPQRGQIIHLGIGDVNTRHWPIVNGFRGHYMVPWPDRRIAVGATRETGSGYDPRTSAAGVREVLDEALRVAPGLATAEIRDIRVGLRPYTHDHLPVLGTVPGADGVFLCTGHGPTGLQLGPYSGKLVAELALGREIGEDLSPFSVGRG
ncbi:MAG: FAD-dependent oxidoreductase [Caldilineaceae bacterium]